LQLALASADRDMRAFGPVVLPLDPEVGDSVGQQKRRAISRTLVGDPLGRGDPLLLEELAHQLAGGSRVRECQEFRVRAGG